MRKGLYPSKLTHHFLLFPSLCLMTVLFIMLFCVGCTVTPRPFTAKQRYVHARDDLISMYPRQEQITHPITLYEAMARALKYNLDIRLKMMEIALSQSDTRLASYQMLPDLVASAGYLARDSQHINTASGLESQDKSRRVADLKFSWNILDFGVSYIVAQQKADMYLIALERRNSMVQNILRDIRYAYWRALSAQRLIKKLRVLRTQVRSAIRKSRLVEAAKIKGSYEALSYQRALWDTLREISELETKLIKSKASLTALMNLRPGTLYTLAEPATFGSPLPDRLPFKDVAILEKNALLERPELYEEDYRKRISLKEINKARLNMIPGLTLGAGANYDSNSYLLHNSWVDASARLVWNLMNIVRGPFAIRKACYATQVADAHRLALGVAILTEVDVAYLNYLQAQRRLRVVRKIKALDERVFEQVRKQNQAAKSSKLQLIRSKVNLLLSTLRHDITYADWQNAAGELLVSIGYNPLRAVSTTKGSITQLAAELEQAFNNITLSQFLINKE